MTNEEIKYPDKCPKCATGTFYGKDLCDDCSRDSSIAEIRQQLAEMKRNRDGAIQANQQQYESFRSQLLSASAENLRLKSALDEIRQKGARAASEIAAQALSSTPSELTAALMELMKEVKSYLDDGLGNLHEALARVHTALGANGK